MKLFKRFVNVCWVIVCGIGALFALGLSLGLIYGCIMFCFGGNLDDTTCLLYTIVVVIAICVVPWLKETMDDRKRKNTTSYSSSRSSSSGSWYSGESFNASDYVLMHCRGQRSGVLLQEELDKIESDSTLTTAQKEEAKEEYRWRVGANNL